MKANRKFVEEKEAVSAVIGVILMVAITVAIAATVYVYVTQMMPDDGSNSPTITIKQDDTLAQTGGQWVNFTIHSGSPSAKWGDMRIMVNDTNLGTPTESDDPANGTLTDDACWYKGDNKPIASGDKIYCYIHDEDEKLISGDCDITIIHIPSNAAILSKTIT
jgi:flagellin-like protein